MQAYEHQKACVRMSITIPFVIAPNQKSFKFPLRVEWINEIWYKLHSGILDCDENEPSTVICNNIE